MKSKIGVWRTELYSNYLVGIQADNSNYRNIIPPFPRDVGKMTAKNLPIPPTKYTPLSGVTVDCMYFTLVSVMLYIVTCCVFPDCRTCSRDSGICTNQPSALNRSQHSQKTRGTTALVVLRLTNDSSNV